ENIPATARLFLDKLAILALRALHSDEVLLDVLALWIPAARDEFAVSAMAQHHVAAALRAGFFQRHVGHALSLVEPARRFAVRIAGTGHELAEAPALEDHHPSAILAVLFLRCLRHLGSVKIGKIDRILFGEGAAGRIILFI